MIAVGFTEGGAKEIVGVALAEAETKHLPNVFVKPFTGLLVDFAREQGASVVVKGLRAVTDFEYEFQMALINKKLNRDVETLFLTTNAKYMYLSSSIVKEIARNGGEITDFVHPAVAEDIKKRLKEIEG